MANRNREEAFRVAREMSTEYQGEMICVMDHPDRALTPQVVIDDTLHKYLVRKGWRHLAYFRNGERIR